MSGIVALHVRAWVEIQMENTESFAGGCRPPCEGVGRNAPNCPYLAQRWVALHVRAWVEMMNLALRTWLLSCRPPCEGVGRNGDNIVSWANIFLVALYARAWVEIMPRLGRG